MASTSSRCDLQAKGFLEENDNFEVEIKNRMSWSLEEWIKEGEPGLGMKTFVNSIKFWSRKLKKAIGQRNVVLTLYGWRGDVAERLQDIVDSIKMLDRSIAIAGFSTFRNTKYMAIYFNSEETKDFVLKNLKKVGQNNVAFLSWALDSPVKNLRVSWVPLDIDILSIRQELEKFFVLLEEKREYRMLMDGSNLPAGSICYKGLLKEGIEVDAVPHLTEISDFEALITVQGRQIECLTCGLKGHKSKNCMTPYCNACKGLKPKIHECRNSSGVAIVAVDNLIVMPNDTTEQNLNDKQVFADKENDNQDRSFENDVLVCQTEEENHSAFATVENYFKELNSLNSSDPISSGILPKFIKESGSEIDALAEYKEEKMQVVDTILKRKLTSDITQVGFKSQNLNMSRKNYSRKGYNLSTSDNSSNMFDAVKDKG